MALHWRNCREMSLLVLQGEDRRLRWFERVAVRLHMGICKACPRFEKQVALMRTALPRWRAYRDGAD
jgi:hypothetical protein